MFAALLAVIVVTGCGDDTEETTATTTSADRVRQPDESARAYCEVTRRLNEQQRAPTAEELQALADVAPAGITKEVNLMAERFTAEGPNAGDDPAVIEAVERIEKWNEENCPNEAPAG